MTGKNRVAQCVFRTGSKYSVVIVNFEEFVFLTGENESEVKCCASLNIAIIDATGFV